LLTPLLVKMTRCTSSVPKISNRCKSDPCVRIQYYISDSKLALELSTEVLRVWRTLHTEGMYPYHIQLIQPIEPADIKEKI